MSRSASTLADTDARLLDNIFWSALTGAQAGLAVGAGGARRYAPGFSPIVGFEQPEQPDLASLRPYCESGEQFYCDQWMGPAPADWLVLKEARMHRMIWQGDRPTPRGSERAKALGLAHAPAAVALAALTNPGPFGPRTLEMGDYFGIFDEDRLIAMAGERVEAGRLREISGVCTHPEYRGGGLARLLTELLVERQLRRGQIPFLHVMSANEAALKLYESMGFVRYRETPVRVIAAR